MNAEWMDLLNRVKSGEVSVEEAARLMEEMEAVSTPQDVSVIQQDQLPPEEEPFRPDIGWWRNAWLIPLWVGIIILIPSALFMNWAISNERFFWFYCSWLPLLLGLLVLVIGAWSRQARWAHVRVHDADGSKVSISVPIPLKLTSLGMRLFGSRIEGLRQANMSADDVATIIEELSKTKEPISVEVDDKGGDRVRVYVM